MAADASFEPFLYASIRVDHYGNNVAVFPCFIQDLLAEVGAALLVFYSLRVPLAQQALHRRRSREL